MERSLGYISHLQNGVSVNEFFPLNILCNLPREYHSMKTESGHNQDVETKFRKEDPGTTAPEPVPGQNVWKETYTIRSYEVDARGSISVISICNLMQDAAIRHADALGLAVQDMLPNNYTWVLSRLALRMDAYPGRRDQVRVYTWPSGIQKLFALRDFRITDRENHIIGACVTAWLIIDAKTKRPTRMEPFVEMLNPVTSDRAMIKKLDKLPKLEQHDYEQRFRVRYRDLDVNQHVNNVGYIEWIIEGTPYAVQKGSVLKGLEINYLSEALYGDYIIARCRPKDQDCTVFTHSIIQEEDGKELVRAKTFWNKVD
jgi:acyl-ACP thioesterase